MGISACLIAKNEEGNIRRCLEHIAPYVDEIIIVDGFSTDKTVHIAKEYTEKIFQREFSGSFAVERNFSIEKATEEWVFIIDPDEICEIDLLEKLHEFTTQKKYNAFSFIRKDVLPDGKVIELPWGHPEVYVRLAKRDKIKYYGAIHERAIVKGKIKFYPNFIYHYRGFYKEYPQDKKARFDLIAKTAKNRDQGLEVSRMFLIRRGIKMIILYFFNMYWGMKLYKSGIKGLYLSIYYTYSLALHGIRWSYKMGQI